jgi:hypothetical protein
MKIIDRLFDAQQYRIRATDLLVSMSKDEKAQWLQHPCTMALMLHLQAEFLDIHEGFDTGLFNADTADGTALNIAHARGMLKAIREIAEYIEEVPNYD